MSEITSQADTGLFSQADIDILSRPHVGRAWFIELDLPAGKSYLHSGTGQFKFGGQTWRGVSDPIGGRLVSLSGIEEPRFGQSSAIEIILSGADRAFVNSIYSGRQQLEGRKANIYFATVDAETEKVIIPLRQMVEGKLTSPEIFRENIGTRIVKVTIEDSRWSGLNYDFGEVWNPVGQRRRFPGDKGFDFVGVDTAETYQ